MMPRNMYSWLNDVAYPIMNVTNDHTNSADTITHLRLMRSPMIPEKGLIMPYTQRNTAIRRPKLAADSSSEISIMIDSRIVDSIWRSI